MRLISFLILVLIVAAAAYVWFFQREWLFKTAEEGQHLAQGFTPARTPSEAMQRFHDAIRDRNYSAAALYVSTKDSDYGEQLKRASSGASAVGSDIDQVINLMKDKGLITDKSLVLLRMLDPFPPDFKVATVNKTDETKAVGGFLFDPLPPVNVGTEVSRMDSLMLQNVLRAPSLAGPVAIVAEGEGDAKQWKLNVPLIPVQRMAIDRFVNNYKSYVTALDYLVLQVRNGRMAFKDECEREVVKTLQDANK